MRHVSDEPRNTLGLDFEENLDGFIRFLNGLSVVSYMPSVTVVMGLMGTVLLRVVRVRSAANIFVMLLALNWLSLRWLGHRFLTPAKKPVLRTS